MLFGVGKATVIAALISAALGIWLMAAPAIFGYRGSAADNDWICGPLVVSFGLIAAWGAMRSVRWTNFGIGAWIFVAALVLDYGSLRARISVLVTGLLLALLASIRGRGRQRCGGGWSMLWRSGPAH